MLTSADLVLDALKRHYAHLTRIAEKAKAEADEYLEIGDEALAIYKKLGEIIESSGHGPKVILCLGDLKKRQARMDRIRKKDLRHLLDRQFEAEWQRDLMAQAVLTFESRCALVKPDLLKAKRSIF